MTHKNSDVVIPTKNTSLVNPNLISLKGCIPNIDKLKSRNDFQHDFEFYRYKQEHADEIKSAYLTDLGDYYHTFKYASLLTKAQQNPTNLTNSYWQTLVRFNLSPYGIEKIFGQEVENKPLWGLQRMGQSHTLLPDGREILIGGEYEDFYDPHFFIYNDVIVKHPNGEIEVYGYPKHIFPPTDFHTATLIGDEIWVIGSLGYKDDRQYSHTQVYKLNIYTYEIKQVPTRNSMGWVNSHKAQYKDRQIVVTGGHILIEQNSPHQEQIDTWALNLDTLKWKNLTNYQWQRFMVRRKDLKTLHLWGYKMLQDSANNDEKYKEYKQKLLIDLDIEPVIEVYEQLFIPPIEHTTYDDENLKYNEVAVCIDDILVRYVDEDETIQVYVEGILSKSILQQLQNNLCNKLTKLENTFCEVIDID